LRVGISGPSIWFAERRKNPDDDGHSDVYYSENGFPGHQVRGGEMNRRDFGKTALAITVTAMAAPAALASAGHSIVDSVVIDFNKNRVRWVHLKQPDEKGRKFAYQETGQVERYRHFEFLREDGLVVGQSTGMTNWTAAYDSFENEFLTMYKTPGSKRFTRLEFQKYVTEVRIYLNGWIVPLNEIGNS
jgi:hypothetical protein